MITTFGGKTPNIAKSALISESACIIGDVEIGDDCIVFPGAVLRGDFCSIKIGQGVMIEEHCVLHSGRNDVIIGNNVVVGHGAIVHSHLIGNDVLIGINSTVLHGSEIGDGCIIGANTLVSQDMKVPDNSFVVGTPGKIKGNRSEKHQWWVERNVEIRSQFIEQFRAAKF